MRMHPDMMALVASRGMSDHPSIVGARDQIHAHFLEHLATCEVPEPELDDRDRFLIIAAIDYAMGVAAVHQPFPEAQAYMATVVAALLLEAGFEALPDDDDDPEQRQGL